MKINSDFSYQTLKIIVNKVCNKSEKALEIPSPLYLFSFVCKSFHFLFECVYFVILKSSGKKIETVFYVAPDSLCFVDFRIREEESKTDSRLPQFFFFFFFFFFF